MPSKENNMPYSRREIVQECNRVAHMLDHRMQSDRQRVDVNSHIIVERDFNELRRGNIIVRKHF
jgi:hypothetical protein